MDTTHDWTAPVDADHLADIRARSDELAAGGLTHLILEVLAYAADEARERAGGVAVVTLGPGSVTIADDGRGTDTHAAEPGHAVRKPVMSTRDLRFFDSTPPTLLPDGLPRRGMSVVAALSAQLQHTNRRAGGSWSQSYAYGVPVAELAELPSDGTRGTTVQFTADPGLVADLDVDVVRLRALSAAFAVQHLEVTVVEAAPVVRFRTPCREELAIRQQWLGDPGFMAYNVGWEVDVPSYHRDTGCVDFPPEVWDAWYDSWIGRPERDYWFVEDAAGQFVGHAHYRVEQDEGGRRVAHIGASVHPDHRRRGLGQATFAELVRRIGTAGVADVARNELDAGRVAAIRIHRALGFNPGAVSVDPVHGEITTWELIIDPAAPESTPPEPLGTGTSVHPRSP
ncbi:MAG: GNAT family N-acetyltransferase [Propionibacteriaceae bacterium]|nr:GNAT family N-acetyltransferase [Propionibacteriaceae bacterium]